MGDVLGLRGGGRSLPRFLAGRWMAPHLGSELTEKLANPLIFQPSDMVPNMPPAVVHGYDATILIDLCKAIGSAAAADGRIAPHIVKQAHVIVNASAKWGIRDLVYKLAGYDATRAEAVAAFKLYVQEEAREYEKEFPDQLYTEWYRLYGLPRPARNKPWKFAHLTTDHVYWPLANSSGRVLELTKALKAASGQRSKRLHQFLSDVGVKALRTHLGQLLGIARFSDSKTVYEDRVEQAFGKQTAINFTSPRTT
jgi:hypothetical protein